jgi:hypothetical protein
VTDELRNQIVGTVVGGLILAAILAFPLRRLTLAAWEWFVRFLARAGRALLIRVTVPIGGLVVIGVVAALAMWGMVRVWVLIVVCVGELLLVRRPHEAAVAPRPDPAPPAPESDDVLTTLDEIEIKILGHFVRQDTAYLDMQDFQRATHVSRLRITSALDHLEEVGLISAHHNRVHGPQWSITRKARDLLIKEGLV